MQKYKSNVVTVTGAAVRGVPVSVLNEAGALASIFMDRAGSSPAPNPLTTADDGTFFFYAPNGRYSLRTSANGATLTDSDVVLMFDPLEFAVELDGKYATAAQGAKADAALQPTDAVVGELFDARDVAAAAATAAQNYAGSAGADASAAFAAASSAALSESAAAGYKTGAEAAAGSASGAAGAAAGSASAAGASAANAAQSALDAADASRLSIGTVTTSAAGSSASATITGDPGEQMLSLTIPRGDPGGDAPTITTHTTLPVDGVSTDNPYLYYDQPSGIAKMYLRTPGGVYIELGGSQVDPGTPPEEIDPDAMLLGMNFEWIRTWTNTAKVFSNLLFSVEEVIRASGSGSWTYDRGSITSTDPDATFRFKLLDGGLGLNLPEGDYTVLNPSGNAIYIGGIGPIDPVSASWRTDTSFTVSLSGPGARYLHAKGGLSNSSGNTCVIMPGHLESWNSGNVWYDKCLSFYAGLKLKTLRFMDAINASNNLEADWSDRSLPTATTLHNSWGCAGFYANMTHEFICDLANRLGVDPWVCVPHRATQDYVEQMAALYKAHLNPGRKVFLEGTGNEVWNNQAAWASGTRWITYLQYTKMEAAASAANQNFSAVGHTLVDGDIVHLFEHIDNRWSVDGGPYQLKRGSGMYVKKTGSDTFEVYATYSGGVFGGKPVIPSGFEKVLYTVESEAGKTADLNGNYALVSKRNWDAFDAELGRSRVVHILARQFGNSSTISQALAVPGVKAATDFVAVAPYFGGYWVGGKLDAGDGTIAPSWWCNKSMTVRAGLYAHGATPSKQDVIDGVGAIKSWTLGYINAAGDKSVFDSVGAAATGLTNGTAYDVHFVFTDDVADFDVVGTITPSAEPVTPVIVTDSFANQKLRNLISTASKSSPLAGWWTDVKSAADGVPIANYECGLHYHESRPNDIGTWLAAYQESQEFADAISADMLFNQMNGVRNYNYYAAVLGTVFSIANSYDDTSDKRYLAYKAADGYINPVVGPVVSDHTLDVISSEPSSYPHELLEFEDTAATYEIVGGNTVGRYSVSGSSLILNNSTGIDYDDIRDEVVSVKAQRGGVSLFSTTKVPFGLAWFERDAIWAWDGYHDTDPSSQITPRIGQTLPKSGSGSAVTVSEGWWTVPDGIKFQGGVGTIDTADNVFFAVTVRMPPSAVPDFVYSSTLGASAALRTYTHTGGKVRLLASGFGATPPYIPVDYSAEGKYVFWMVLRNGKDLSGGINQASGTPASAADAVSSISRNMQIADGRASKGVYGFGAFQVLVRPSITDAEAKAMVAKMQALHGIA